MKTENSSVLIRIYQINLDRDKNRVAFMSHDSLTRLQGDPDIDASIYDMVYECEVEENVGLEDIFRIFNVNHPEDYTARSLSVSDVVEVISRGSNRLKPGCYYCDTFGFARVTFEHEDVPKNIPLGTFEVDVEMQPDARFDIYLYKEGSSGIHYKDLTLEEIGTQLSDMIAMYDANEAGFTAEGE